MPELLSTFATITTSRKEDGNIQQKRIVILSAIGILITSLIHNIVDKRTGRLAQKGLISEIEADTIRPDIQVTGDARNSLAGEKPESSSPTAEEQ